MVIAFTDEDKAHLDILYERGIKNGVKNLKMLTGDEARRIEPNLSKNVTYVLHALDGSITCPYELTIAAIGNAMDNGAELKLNFEVCDIKEKDGYYEIYSENDMIKSKTVINAAGVYSDKVASFIGDTSFTITPRRGEYILLDKVNGDIVKNTIFRTPSKMGKGILVSPTVDGNLITGPTSYNIEDKENNATTEEGFFEIIKQACENVDKVNYRNTITSFCGVRAVGNTGDFIITSPKRGFINAAGIESPGLSASPAIAEYIVEMLKEAGYELTKNENFNPIRKPMHYFKEASIEEKNEIIKKDKSFGRVICRCETVTEGEILEAIRTNPKPTDLDGVKRRTRAQMGRCQGGFCSPYIINLLSKELNIPVCEITKSGKSSYITVSKTKEV